MNLPEFQLSVEMAPDEPDVLLSHEQQALILNDIHIFFDDLEDRLVTRLGDAQCTQITENRLEFGWYIAPLVINNVIEKIGFFTNHSNMKSRYSVVDQTSHSPQARMCQRNGYAIDTKTFTAEYCRDGMLNTFGYKRQVDCFTPDSRPLPPFPMETFGPNTINDLEKKIVIESEEDMMAISLFQINEFSRLLRSLSYAAPTT